MRATGTFAVLCLVGLIIYSIVYMFTIGAWIAALFLMTLIGCFLWDMAHEDDDGW